MKQKARNRLLNGKDLFFLAMGQTIGAGIIANTGIAIGIAGSGVLLGYLLAFVVTFVGYVPHMLFATVNPVASPTYVATSWLSKKLGGYWLYTQIIAVFAQAYMGSAFGLYLNSIAPSISPQAAACAILIVFYIINLFDLKTSAIIQNITTAILLLALLSFIALGAPKCDIADMFSRANFMYGGWLGIFNSCALVLFGVGGFSIIIQFASKMEEPRRNIPKISAISAICCFFAFGLVAFVGSGVAPISEVAGKPMTYQATLIYPGKSYLIFVIGGALLAIITTINANYARYWATIIRGVDEGWLPHVFAKRNRHGVPIVLHTLFFLMAIVPNLLGMDIGSLSTLAACIALIPALIPAWGFVSMPEHCPEEWASSGRIAKIFASKRSRVLLCLVSTVMIGVFVVLNILKFNLLVTIIFFAYFIATGIVCFGFGDRIIRAGEKRLIEDGAQAGQK